MPFNKGLINFFRSALFFLMVLIGTVYFTQQSFANFSVRGYIPHRFGNDASMAFSRFKVIDDFSSGDHKNRIGGLWGDGAGGGENVRLEYSDDEAVAAHGYSLKIKYEIPAKKHAIVSTDLNYLDISQAQGLSFWINLSAVADPDVEVYLEDHRGKTSSVRLKGQLNESSKQWQEIYIPVEKWKKLDFNRLKKFGLKISAKNREDGIILLDQISFFGEEDVYFDSLKDNLKGFPGNVENKAPEIAKLNDKDLLLQVAKDTWKFFENAVDAKTHLPVNRVKVDWQKEIGDYSSPTDIGLYYAAIISAYELGFIQETEAHDKILESLKVVESLPKWKGFLFNYYNTTNLQVTDYFVSTVDNGWFAASLFLIKAYFPGSLGDYAEWFLDEMDFGDLYDHGSGQFLIGYHFKQREHSKYHYGLLVSEARIASLIAIAKRDIEQEHWFLMHRTPPSSWDWQTQQAEGVEKEHRTVRFFGGYYKYNNKKIVPSWGGSLFEYLMPTIFVDEKTWMPRSFGLNNERATEAHIHYARNVKRYPIWGISPCMVERGPRSDYREFGVSDIAVKGYRDSAIITPHVSFLALAAKPKEALENIRMMLRLYPVYGEYGFYDSIILNKAGVTKQYLALDQAMILISAANYFRDGIIQKRFGLLEEIAELRPLLSEESFFEKK